jgi:hypothetical protein
MVDLNLEAFEELLKVIFFSLILLARVIAKSKERKT